MCNLRVPIFGLVGSNCVSLSIDSHFSIGIYIDILIVYMETHIILYCMEDKEIPVLIC